MRRVPLLCCHTVFRLMAGAVLLASLAACISSHAPPVGDGTRAASAFEAGDGHARGTGPDPVLPAPEPQQVPVVEIAPAVGWSEGETPMPADGFAVTPFALGLQHPRTVLALPNGDVLVAESDAPASGEPPGLKQLAMKAIMKRAGSGDEPSADRITLLRDADGDGIAEERHVFVEGLTSPFGMALVADTLYIANADALVRVPYQEGQTTISARPEHVVELPAGRNHHWTKSLVASADGSRLYVGVGSNSNIAEHGMEEEVGRAAVLEVDPATGGVRTLATGLRNPTALALHPSDNRLWAAVNERDGLGDDLVPDYITSVRAGAFYGWPWSYFGQHVDPRVRPRRPDKVKQAVVPDYALGSHVAPLGLAFHSGVGWPADYGAGAIVGLHGSWNRQPKVGYTVDFVPFSGGRPSGPMRTLLGRFVNDAGEARGRPTGVAVDSEGGVLVADDVGDAVWRLTAEEGGDR